jgi:CelD/BcsL family acetyltransferase involved in cellulose biosynthesis
MNLFQRFLTAPPQAVEWEGMRAVLLEDWPGEGMDQWKELARGADYTFFHAPIWKRAVWGCWRPRGHGHGRGRLRVAVVWRGRRLVGVLPMQFSRKAGYQTPAPHITDYLDPLIAADALPCAGRLILRLLRDHPPLTLHNVRSDAPTLAAWRTAAAAEGWTVQETVAEQCPVLPLPSSVDQWMDRLTPHFRKELRRKIRKVMEKGGGRLERCQPDRAEAGIEQLIALMQHRGQKAVDVQRTLGPILRAAGPVLIRDGRLRLSTLVVHDRPAACILESPTPRGPMLYNSGFDTGMKAWSPGLVAVALSIGRSIEQGERQYDFLRGQEPYKYELGAEDRALLRLVLRPR